MVSSVCKGRKIKRVYSAEKDAKGDMTCVQRRVCVLRKACIYNET